MIRTNTHRHEPQYSASARTKETSTTETRTGPTDKVSITGASGHGPKLMDPVKLRAVTGMKKPASGRPHIGTAKYYEFRHKDFLRRNPGKKPPDYYLKYGKKYFERFHRTKHRLSKCGKQFVNRVGVKLQQKLEQLRERDPAAFARLEKDGDAFRKFAYGTHPSAYIEAGLSRTSTLDRVFIGLTPDTKDLLNRDGIKQVLQTGAATVGLDILEKISPILVNQLIPRCK